MRWSLILSTSIIVLSVILFASHALPILPSSFVELERRAPVRSSPSPQKTSKPKSTERISRGGSPSSQKHIFTVDRVGFSSRGRSSSSQRTPILTVERVGSSKRKSTETTSQGGPSSKKRRVAFEGTNSQKISNRKFT